MADVSKEKPTFGATAGNGSTLSMASLARGGRIDVLKERQKAGANMDERDENWTFTPLMFAITERKYEVAKFLRDSGADVLAKDGDGESVLSKAARAGVEYVNLVVENVNPVNILYALVSPDSQGFTPLMNAAIEGKIESLVKLIQLGAPISAKNADGDTAAHLAAAWGHIALVSAIYSVSEEASILATRNNNDQDVADIARDNGYQGHAKTYRSWIRGNRKVQTAMT